MANFDPDNYIKLFRLDDSRDSTYPEKAVLIPADEKNAFQLIFRSEFRGQPAPAMETENPDNIPDEGINLLVKFRHELDELFQDCGDIPGIADLLWEDISRRLFEQGFHVSGKQCTTLWETFYPEYLEVANTDDEARVLEFRHFTAFEDLYELRSKYIDSKIVEDITEYLNSRPDCPKTGPDLPTTSDKKTASSQSLKKAFNRDEFSSFSNEEDSQMLIEAITAAQNILEENLKHPDYQMSDEAAQIAGDMRADLNSVEKSSWRNKKSKKPGGTKLAVEGETSLSLEHKKTDVETTAIDCPSSEMGRQDMSGCQVFLRSENNEFCWDTDSMQCFLDFRLYVESNKQTKRSVRRIYKTLVKFVSQKMLQSGFKVSEIDCKKKWEQLLRYYNREIRKMKISQPLAVRTYFWQMDKVLKKSGLDKAGANYPPDFIWDQDSIRALIAIRISMENAFSMFKKYIILWQYVASQMMKQNFSPTYNECSLKWMEVCEIYRICLESVKRGAKEEDIGWNFYQDMRQGFRLNAQNNEVAINYRCKVATETQAAGGTECEEKSAQGSATRTSYSESGIPAETKSDTLSRTEDLSTENSSDHPSMGTEAGQSTLTIAIQQCNALENMLKRAGVEDEPKAEDPHKMNKSVEIITLEDLHYLDSEGNLEARPGSPKSLSSQVSGTQLLKFADAFAGKKQFGQSYSEFKKSGFDIEEVKAATCKEEKNFMRWTEEATTFLIKSKISRELKFRSGLYPEINSWKEIAADMQRAGHNVSHKSCSARWFQLMEAYKDNPSPENNGIMNRRYREQFKLLELPLPSRNAGSAQPPKNQTNLNNGNSNSFKMEWTESAVTCLIELKFSEEIRYERLYGAPIAARLKAAGFPGITPLDVSKKWSRLFVTYRNSLSRKEMGQPVTWKYFELMDNHVKGLASCKKHGKKKNAVPFAWTPRSVQRLIDLRLVLEGCCHMVDQKSLTSMWKILADQMNFAGYQVSHQECSAKWQFLVNAYMRTKQGLKTGNGTVIGKYFMMMDKALNELNGKDAGVEKPINFSISRMKRKLEDTREKKNVASIHPSFTGTVGTSSTQKVQENEEENTSMPSIDKDRTDLGLEMAASHSGYPLVDSSIEIEGLTENDTCVSSSVDSSLVCSPNKQEDVSLILISANEKSQQEACECADNVISNNDHVDSSKENLVCTGRETRSKASGRENMRLRTLGSQKTCKKMLSESNPQSRLRVLAPHTKNVLIKDRAVNSGENKEADESTRRWSQTGTNALIDLKLEHDQKLVGWSNTEIEWEKVAAQLLRLGYKYTSEECKERWYSLKTTYEKQIADIQAKSVVQAWPYFWKMDSFYKKLANLCHGFEYILSRKRAHEEERSTSPKKLAFSTIKPLERVVSTHGTVG